MSANSYAPRVEAIVAELVAKAETLAAEVRRDLVLPACKEHGLGFSTYPNFYFHGRVKDFDEEFSSEIDAKRLGFESLVPVLAVLNLPVTGNDILGDYVADVPEPAPKARR